MGLSLDLKQTQHLMPKLIQTMEVLQMGTLELQEHVKRTLLENPVLELESESLRPEYPELVRKLTWLAANDRQNQWYHQEDAQDLMELVAPPTEETLYDHLKSQLDFTQFPPRLALAVDCVLTGPNTHGFWGGIHRRTCRQVRVTCLKRYFRPGGSFQTLSSEDKQDPFSDQKLCDLMASQGVLLSRRTVSKYRDELGISSSSKRKNP